MTAKELVSAVRSALVEAFGSKMAVGNVDIARALASYVFREATNCTIQELVDEAAQQELDECWSEIGKDPNDPSPEELKKAISEDIMDGLVEALDDGFAS
jgi:NADH/NAD ratio-sensing transcriptional regulator Rex